MQVEIRDYTPSDRAHLRICLDAMADHIVRLDPWKRVIRTSGDTAAFIRFFLARTRKDSGFILVAEVGGTPVGVAVAWVRRLDRLERATELPTRAGMIADLSVLPAWRSKGIGTRLIRASEARFRRLGCDQIFLGVFDANRKAVRLYHRLGYESRNRRLGKRVGRPRTRWPTARPPARSA